MPTTNSWNSPIPVTIAEGGTNATSMTNTDGVCYFDGTGISTTTVGTASQVLTSNGAGVAPTFQNLAMKLIETLPANNSASLTFDNIPTNYNTYLLVMRNVTSTTDDVNLTMLMSKDNGANWITTNYESAVVSNWYSTTTTLVDNSTTSFILSKTGISNASASEAYNGHIYIYGANLASKPYLEGRACLYSAHDSVTTFNNIFAMGGDTNLNALKLSMTAGNISAGVFSLYGLVE